MSRRNDQVRNFNWTCIRKVFESSVNIGDGPPSFNPSECMPKKNDKCKIRLRRSEEKPVFLPEEDFSIEISQMASISDTAYTISIKLKSDVVFTAERNVSLQDREDEWVTFPRVDSVANQISLGAYKDFFYKITGIPSDLNCFIYQLCNAEQPNLTSYFVRFEDERPLGKGSCCNVWPVVSEYGQPCVLRIGHDIENNLNCLILKELTPVLAYHFSSKKVFSVMERCAGSLHDFIESKVDRSKKQFALSESHDFNSQEGQAQIFEISLQLVHIVLDAHNGRLHRNGHPIAHHDLKPENFLYVDNGRGGIKQLALGDWDFSTKDVDGHFQKRGTLIYLPNNKQACKSSPRRLDAIALCRTMFFQGIFPVYISKETFESMTNKRCVKTWSDDFFLAENGMLFFDVMDANFQNRENPQFLGSYYSIMGIKFLEEHRHLFPFLNTRIGFQQRVYDLREIQAALILEKYNLLQHLKLEPEIRQALEENNLFEKSNGLLVNVHLPSLLIDYLDRYYDKNPELPLLSINEVKNILRFILHLQGHTQAIVNAFFRDQLEIIFFNAPSFNNLKAELSKLQPEIDLNNETDISGAVRNAIENLEINLLANKNPDQRTSPWLRFFYSAPSFPSAQCQSSVNRVISPVAGGGAAADGP